MADLKAKPPLTPSSRQSFVHPTLLKTSHVFVRRDAVRKQLQCPYDGPYKVIKWTDNFFYFGHQWYSWHSEHWSSQACVFWVFGTYSFITTHHYSCRSSPFFFSSHSRSYYSFRTTCKVSSKTWLVIIWHTLCFSIFIFSYIVSCILCSFIHSFTVQPFFSFYPFLLPSFIFFVSFASSLGGSIVVCHVLWRMRRFWFPMWNNNTFFLLSLSEWYLFQSFVIHDKRDCNFIVEFTIRNSWIF